MNDHSPLTDIEIDISARTMWGEARGEGTTGLQAIAHVIYNRVRLAQKNGGSWWGNTIIEVCKRPFQFSCWNRNDANYKPMLQVDLRNPTFRLARQLALIAFQVPTLRDPTQGATHYHRYDMRPSWARGREPVTRIGAHLFYKIPEDV